MRLLPAGRRADAARIALLAVALLPFFLLVPFSHPTNDDYVAAESVREMGIVGCNVFWYQAWVGRFAATAAQCLTPLALGSIAGVRAVEAAFLVALVAASFLFVSALAPRPTARSVRIGLALFLVVAHLQQLGTLVEYAYWLTAVLTYELGEILLLVAVAAWVRAERGGRRAGWIAAAASAAFLGSGTNEVIMLLLDGIFALALSERLARRRSPLAPAVILAAAGAATAIVVLAPGTARRLSASSGLELTPAIVASLTAAARSAGTWLASGPLVPAAVLVAVGAAATARETEWSPPSPIFTGAATLVAYAGAFLPSFFGAGKLEPHTANTIHLVLSVGLLYHAAVLGRRLALRGDGWTPRPAAVTGVALHVVVGALVVLPPSSNVRTAWEELLSGQAEEYAAQLDRRYAAIEACRTPVCVVPRLTARPKTLFFFEDAVDWAGDTDWYKGYKGAYARHFGKKAVLLAP